ncbi:hypothetical protein DEIPH_ctg017orf0197 [Deinococcus phoenicis]|uniref:DUF805 domain-containing protein n=1 Tax=Deinococcus phoenicis TaxID=1476583 RepID=A0A016QRY3_9DEIO|nr:DUF805 domain-containing protein [Deinococcus phoenicis]EYB68823.1 hypothetical protein DEIPH_ctg017orf0197 [Deinococcus phoenicis]
MNEYLNVIRNHYADFRGRARRREYWMFVLINGVITLILQLPYLFGGAAQVAAGESLSGLALLSLLVSSLYGLAVLVPSLAVGVRRLHDTGRSGWWMLIGLIPFVGGIILLIFTVMDSQPGSNKWGPNPKGLGSAGTTPAAW